MTYSFIAKPRLASLLLHVHGWYVRIVLQGLFLLITTVVLFADPLTTTTDDKAMQGVAVEQPKHSLQEDVTLDYTYVGNADLRSGLGGHLGEQTTRFGYSVKAPVNDQLSLRFGLDYNRLDFGLPSGSPLPYNLQEVAVNIGASYKLSDQWAVFAQISPRLQTIDNWDRVESQDFQLGGAVGATYDPNPDLSLRFGLAANPGAIGTPVLPVLGLRWHFAKPWTLNFGFPRTSLDYQLLPNLRLTPVEIGFEGGSFHTSKTYGNSFGMAQLNDRKLDYSEVRVGSGADYALTKDIHIGLNAGAVVYRKFDFQDASFSPKVDPAPYVQLGVKVDF